jgi:hypothetical protein
MNIGTFLLMQSPAARPAQEVYARVLKSMELFAKEVMPAIA